MERRNGSMKIKTLIKRLNKEYPLQLAESWDNVGLLVGDDEREITKVQISLDATEEVIDRAIEVGANLIITHHPMIFSGLKNITSKNFMGRKILKLIENKIAVYSMHTNLDSANGGLNEYIVQKLGVTTSKILDERKDFENNSLGGLGRIYTLETPTKLGEYLEVVKDRLSIETIRVVGDLDKKIKKIAIINGSGASYLNKINKLGVDLFITGDIKYHEGLDAREMGISLFDIGHYESEYFFTDLIIKHCEGVEVEVFNDKPVFKNL
jgi:dinuclear metal center YbgI/SA1388 family protein